MRATLSALILLLTTACAVEPASTDDAATAQTADLSGDPACHAREDRALSVMTINLRRDSDQMERRLPILAKEIAKQDPDLVGMQEVMIVWRQAERLVDLIVEAGGPRYELSQHHKPGVYGFLTGEGIAVLSRWPIVESKSVDLGAVRTAQLARVALPSGAHIAMFNTHLENGQTPEKEAIRKDEAERLVRFVGESAGCDASFLTGDFNSVPSGAAMQLVLANGFVDSAAAVHDASAGPTFPVALADGAFEQHATMRIDFVLTRGTSGREARPVESSVVFREPDAKGFYGSDHFGVLSTFRASL